MLEWLEPCLPTCQGPDHHNAQSGLGNDGNQSGLASVGVDVAPKTTTLTRLSLTRQGGIDANTLADADANPNSNPNPESPLACLCARPRHHTTLARNVGRRCRATAAGSVPRPEHMEHEAGRSSMPEHMLEGSGRAFSEEGGGSGHERRKVRGALRGGVMVCWAPSWRGDGVPECIRAFIPMPNCSFATSVSMACLRGW